MTRLADIPLHLADLLETAAQSVQPTLDTTVVGRVSRVAHGLVDVAGFASIQSNEVLRLPRGLLGLAVSIRRRSVGVILLGAGHHLRPGDAVYRSGIAISVPVGPALLGRIVNPLGGPLDDAGPIRAAYQRSVWSPAPPIILRAPVTEPLQTGIKTIDATIPIGKGQRELIIGDRQTGKTAIAVTTMINQSAAGVISIYCTIGQRASATARVLQSLKDSGALPSTIVVATSGDDTPGLQYVAPYAAMAMAEHFMHQGRDVLVVFDDLTRHARAYRELSLLMRRPPGREAYPGDIFHIHAILLERATQLSPTHGGGSITALPIVETQAGDIAAYIPTNLISITDGQILVTPRLFHLGVLPAIDIGRSVSRVGGKAQLPIFRSVVQALKLSYAQFEELESFARFGTRLDDETRTQIERGRRVREILKQGEHDRLTVAEQIAVLLATTSGLIDDIPVDSISTAEEAIRASVRNQASEINELLTSTERLDTTTRGQAITTLRALLRASGFHVRE